MPRQPKSTTKTTKKKQQPKPRTLKQSGAPFEHIKEPSPEPADDPNEFDFNELHEDEWEPEQAEDDDDVSEINYEATSMTDDDDNIAGSLSSLDFFEPRTVVIEAKTPPGIEVSFDDESWIM